MPIQQPPKMPPATVNQVEFLLREQISASGDDLNLLAPEEISASMQCTVHPDGSLLYSWKGDPVLHVLPELDADGSIHWRMFTRGEEIPQ